MAALTCGRTCGPLIARATRDEGGPGRGVHRHRERSRPTTDPRCSAPQSLARVIFVDADFSAGAEARYLEAVARRDAIRDAWIAEGSPLLSQGSTGQLVEHPYLKMLREHDLLVDRLGAVVVRRAHRGPEPSAVLKPTIGNSPASKLRACNEVGRRKGELLRRNCPLIAPSRDRPRPASPYSLMAASDVEGCEGTS